MRKNTKIGLVATIIIFFIASVFFLYYFTRPQVNVIFSNEESLLLDDYFHNRLFSSYRIKKSIYPEVVASDYYFFTPIAALKAESDGLALENSSTYSISSNNYDLLFSSDDVAKWNQAIEIDKKLKTALLYNESNNKEKELSKDIKCDLKIPYQDIISFINADEIKSELDRNSIGTLLVLNPSSVINIFSRCKELTIVVSSIYGKAIDELLDTYVVIEDFNSMLKSLVRGEKGEVSTPYTLSSTKKGIKVVLDYLF